MQILDIKLSDLHPYEANPRKNDAAIPKVMASIEKFGFKNPIVIDKNNVIVCGHTRYRAAKKLKLKSVPCIMADDLSDEQIKAFRLADNKVAEYAEWDIDLLVEELEGIEEINMEDFGFDISISDEPEAVEDEFEEEEPEEVNVKPGDVWILGRHRLMCGDSTNEADVKTLVDGNIIDLLITDPPYNVDYVGKTKDALKIENDKMEDGHFREFLNDAFQNAVDALKPGGVFYIWHADSEGLNFRLAANGVGLTVRECLVWKKNSMVLGRQDYQWRHEPCLYGWKDGGAHLWNSDRKQTTILEFDRPTKSKIHPTMKPVKLFDYQIRNSSREGENILDLFGGSGTTIIACEQNGRNGFCMEYDPKYAQAIINRWEALTGEKAVLCEA